MMMMKFRASLASLTTCREVIALALLRGVGGREMKARRAMQV